MIDAFISYSHEDQAIADAVCATLEASGIRCWIASRDIPPGQNRPARIISAVNALALSPGAEIEQPAKDLLVNLKASGSPAGRQAIHGHGHLPTVTTCA